MDKTSVCVPPTYDAVCTFAASLCARYPFLRPIPVGKSVCGRDIIGLALDGGDPILLAGGFHALEWLTPPLLLEWLDELCGRISLGYTPRRGIVVVPCVNPDGTEIVLRGIDSAGSLAPEVMRISGGDVSGWSANARGVDLNHNYDAGWRLTRMMERRIGIDGPAPRRYGGDAPASEPETQAMISLCERYRFAQVYAFHSQGEEIYWKYGIRTPRTARGTARELARLSGYRLCRPELISACAGFKDWFIKTYRRPGFTIEIGKGKNPLPPEDLDAIYASLRPMMEYICAGDCADVSKR